MTEWEHGARTYRNHGCRCDICRQGNREAMRTYRARQPEAVLRKIRRRRGQLLIRRAQLLMELREIDREITEADQEIMVIQRYERQP